MKIFLNSDVHIGMKFAGYPDIQEKLVNARFDALQQSVMTANKRDCELFVVGGDLFDRVTKCLSIVFSQAEKYDQ